MGVKELYRYSSSTELDILTDVSLNSIVIQGILGKVFYTVSGDDIVFTKNSCLLKSKISFCEMFGLLKKAIMGVTQGFFLELEFIGVGYRFIMIKKRIVLRLGYSDNITYVLPKNVRLLGYKKRMVLFGLTLGEISNLKYALCTLRIINVYKGKGLRLKGEVLKLKIGKQR